MAEQPTILKPEEIESESFRIIDSEIGPHQFDEQQWPIVRRVIHTTADFELAEQMRFSWNVVEQAVSALQGGAKILCDTNMVLSGVNKSRLVKLGGSIACHVADPQVADEAKAAGLTRSTFALRKGVEEGCNIFLIGNAPTALFELLRLAEKGDVDPALVVGVPVGFVGAAESKGALIAADLPYIAIEGRKGGSAIAAAILNALMIQAEG
ncbi:precorrin-8X methylmutase [Malonomonas rubra DSM 5091]|uniref:Precorrin-8X methylmutase n=1 Tax=Malonomonas rubra DSM 5091 TaxID=1122189 RepID=A0A1M6GLU8_MALRU|nr:precorrin-8X methylmutase [Malonomonas rubra]SHJ10924.1 precorrin-8X methylmutase [Malonomonas rubra DSM 5091]